MTIVNETVGVSIVVTCRNNERTIGECLESIANLDYPKTSMEILVVDACSSDGTVEIANRYANRVESLPVNAAAAYNYAQKIARFDVLGFVDADAKVENQWLRKLVPHLSEHLVAGVSGSIETWNTANPWARVIGYEIKNRYGRLEKFTGRIATMNLLLKRRVIEEVGGWDEAFPSQYDTEFGFRMTALGYKIAYEPSAKCFHFNRETVRSYWLQQLQYGKNTFRLYLKYRQLVRGDEITDLSMNVQPPLLLAVAALLLLGILPLLRPLWFVSGGVLVAMFVYYLYAAAKLSAKFKDRTAMRLVVLFFVRTCAWTAGAAKAVFGGRRKA